MEDIIAEGVEEVEGITVGEGGVEVEVKEDLTGDLLHLKTDMEGMTVEEGGVKVEEDITGGLLYLRTVMKGMTGETLQLMAEDPKERLEDMRDNPPVGLTGAGMGIMTDTLLEPQGITDLEVMRNLQQPLVEVLLQHLDMLEPHLLLQEQGCHPWSLGN